MNNLDRNRAVIVLDLLGEEMTDENIQAWLASGQPEEEEVQCQQCGAPCKDDLCDHCYADNRDNEDTVNDYREERRAE